MTATPKHPQPVITESGNSHNARFSFDLLGQLQVADPEDIFPGDDWFVMKAVKPTVNLGDLLAQMPDSEGLALLNYGSSVGRELP